MAVGYGDLDSLVESLREANPRVDPRPLTDAEIGDLVTQLEDFDGTSMGTSGAFEEIRAIWHWGE
jgi:Fe-S-cluster formation regulator IscX/YfhJ